MGCPRDPSFVVDGEYAQSDVMNDLMWQTGFGHDEHLADLLGVLEE